MISLAEFTARDSKMLSKFFSKCHAKMLGWKCRKTSWNGWGGENVRSGWYKQGRRDDTWRPGICLFLFDPCTRTLSCVLYLPPRCLSPFHFVMSRSCDIQLLVRLVTNFCFTRWKTFYSLFCKNGEIRWFFFCFEVVILCLLQATVLVAHDVFTLQGLCNSCVIALAF